MARRAATATVWDERAAAAPAQGASSGQGPFDVKISRFFDRLEQPFYILDRQWRFRFVNRAAERFWSRDRSGLAGKCIWDCFPQARDSEACRLHYDALASLWSVDAEVLSPVLRRAIRLMIKPCEDGVSVCFQLERGKRLLLAEDSQAVAQSLGTFLEENGWSVTTASCGATAEAAIRHLCFDAAILDEVLPQGRGSALAELQQMQATPAVIMSGYPVEFPSDSARLCHLQKPFRLHRLEEILAALTRKDGRSAGG